MWEEPEPVGLNVPVPSFAVEEGVVRVELHRGEQETTLLAPVAPLTGLPPGAAVPPKSLSSSSTSPSLAETMTQTPPASLHPPLQHSHPLQLLPPVALQEMDPATVDQRALDKGEQLFSGQPSHF